MIDWGQVRQLQDDIGKEELDDLIEVFLLEVDETLGTLPADFTKTDLGELSATFHFLKGCASNLGFSEFQVNCSKGEETAKNGHAPDFTSAEFYELYKRSKTYFMDQYKTQIE